MGSEPILEHHCRVVAVLTPTQGVNRPQRSQSEYVQCDMFCMQPLVLESGPESVLESVSVNVNVPLQ